MAGKKENKKGTPVGQARGKIKEIKKEFKFNFNIKNFFLWIVILFVTASIFASFQQAGKMQAEKPLSQVLSDIREEKIKEVEVKERELVLTYKNGDKVISYKEPQSSFLEILQNANIDPKKVQLKVSSNSFFDIPIWEAIGNLLPIIFMVGFFWFLMRQAKGAQSSLFSFGQSTAKLFDREKPKVTFADVAGVDEAKEEMEEVVDFLKHPKKYKDLGARTPKGVLLVGPSGTGKTLLARAVAGQAEVPFYSMAGSEFMEMLVGVGSSRMRDLFRVAKKNAPAIIFIDEIDAIGRARSLGAIGGHDEREQTLNQMLVEMDGFEPNEQVVIIGASNRGDMLDPALLRPGRFDRRITLDLPDIEGREKILSIHAKGKPFKEGVKWNKVAKRTVGFSGADLENMLNEAAILAARARKKKIDMEDIEEAATKVKLGPEKKRLQSDEDRRMTAYHEAGHALCACILPDTDPVHRISIVSRGRALGFNLIVPEKDRTHETRSRMLSQIVIMMGGRAAEELIFKEMTSGAANDIDIATRIARGMVEEFGMSKLGPIDFGPKVEHAGFGRAYYGQQQISPAMQSKIDNEVKNIIDKAYTKARKILRENKLKLDRIAEELLKKETLDWEELKRLMRDANSKRKTQKSKVQLKIQK
jgi:cell division protease FtsH